MKLDIGKTKKITEALVDGIAEKAICTHLVPRFWQLYLDANVEFGLDKVDTCATSQCLSVLAKAQYKDEDLISEAVSSVVRLRNQEGSWPSAITPEEMADPNSRRPGDTAIGDNCFALTALIDAGFLSESFKYTKFLSKEYGELSFRISYVLTAVEWMLKNKAHDEIGWHYTDSVATKTKSFTTPTLNVLQLFSEIIYCLQQCENSNQLTLQQKNYCKDYVAKLKSQLQTAIQAFKDAYENIQNQWLAIGSQPGSHDASLLHTCKLVNLVLFNKHYNQTTLLEDEYLQDMVNFVVDNISEEGLKNYAEPYIFEVYDLSKTSGLGLLTRTISVDHENCAESILLSTAINIHVHCKSIDSSLISYLTNILTTQERMSLAKPYFFLSRSPREEKNNWHCPVYSTYEAYKALVSFMSHHDLIYLSEQTETEFADHVSIEEVDGAIANLEKAIHMNIHNNGFPSVLANQYLKQLKTLRNSSQGTKKTDFYALLAEINQTTGVSF